MSTIKVLSDIDSSIDVQQLSLEERAILFDKIAAETPDIPQYVFTQFLEEFNEELSKKLLADMPELPELLLKNIIKLSCSVTNSRVDATQINTPNTVLPIVGSVTGGELPALKILKPKVSTAPTRAGAIRVRFDRSIIVSNEAGVILNTAPGDDINVIGLRFGFISRNYRDATYRNVRGVFPLGAYRVEDVYDDSGFHSGVYSEGIPPSNSIPAIFSIVPAVRNKILFNGDVKKQLAEIFMDLVRGIYMPTSFGYFASTLISEAVRELSAAPTAASKSNPICGLLYPFNDPTTVPAVVLTEDSSPILTLLNSLEVGLFTQVFKLALTTSVYGRGLAQVYNGAIISGVDASAVRNALVKYQSNLTRKKFVTRVNLEKAGKEIINSTYHTIVISKLGKSRANEILQSAKNDPLTYQTEGIVPFLRPAEKKLVELEYQKQQDYVNAVIGNKCPHVKIYRALRRSIDNAGAFAKLQELQKYYVKVQKEHSKAHSANSVHPTMIKCNNCGFNIICPHYDEYIRLTAKSDRTIKLHMAKYIDTSDRSLERDPFCKICGEILSGIDALEGTTEEIPESMDEELRNFIWSEVAINMKFFRFGPLVEVGKLISLVCDGIYSYIFNIEKQILRSKTATADEIKARKRLFIAIYSFAYMVHLIMSNLHKDIVSMQNFKIHDPKKAIPELIKKSLELILISRSVTIKEIPGISLDIIRNSLVTAYKEISGEGRTEVKEDSTADTQIDLDPVFTSAVDMTVLDNLEHKSSRVVREKIEAELHNKIAGRFTGKKQSVKKSDEGGFTASMFADILIPLAWDSRAFMNIDTNADKKRETKNTGSKGAQSHGKNNSAEIYEKAYPGYVAMSYNIIVRYIIEKLFNYYVAKSPEEYTTSLQELENSFAAVKYNESKLLRHKAVLYPHVHTVLSQPAQKFVDPHVSIARIYDEEGKKHVWDIFVYSDGDKISEYRAPDIAKIISGGKRFDQVATDKKCSVCGILRSQVDELDIDKIEESLRLSATLDSFFRFYETRCPKGDLHVYSENTCTKCGMVIGASSGQQGGINVFRQYKAVYLRDRNELNSSAIPTTAPVYKPAEVSKYESEYSTFAANFSVVTTLADKLNINQKLLLALGATEKIEYNDILSGKYIPREVEERNAPRIITLDAYIRTLYTEWSQLRVFYRFQKPNSEITKLIDSANIPRHELANVIGTLPDIYDDYSSRFEYARQKLKPRDIVAFAIQTFCEKALAIWSVDGPGAALAKLFAAYIVGKILRNDELVSKPGYFSWSAVFGDKESKRDLAETDAEPTTEVQVDTTDDMNETAMSLEAYDVEEDPDAEPDDDPANQVRVGENYGMN
jgi:hypothetical protein